MWRRCVAASIAVGRSAILTGHGHGQAIGAGMDDSAPWKTEETIVGWPRLLVALFALIRKGVAMSQYYCRARRENLKPAPTPRSRS